MIGIGVIGCGYWGPNILRNFSALESCSVRAICDLDPQRLEKLGRLYPALRTETDYQKLLANPEIEAVSICTPVHTHYALAMAALEAGRHVLIEKPLTHSVETAEKLVERAQELGRTLQVDHTFVYSGAVRKIRSIIEAGELGDILYLDSVRVNLGLFQPDVNVLWDLAPHDVSIISHLIERQPLWVSAVGSTHYGAHESQAYVTLKYDEAVIAHIHVNWLAPVKLRQTLIGGSRKMIVYDDLEPSEKIRVYEKGVSLNGDSASRMQALVDYRMGDMNAPYLEKTEPLERVCRTFVDAVQNGTQPPTDGRAGLEVVRVLEAAEKSIRKNGERILV